MFRQGFLARKSFGPSVCNLRLSVPSVCFYVSAVSLPVRFSFTPDTSFLAGGMHRILQGEGVSYFAFSELDSLLRNPYDSLGCQATSCLRHDANRAPRDPVFFRALSPYPRFVYGVSRFPWNSPWASWK